MVTLFERHQEPEIEIRTTNGKGALLMKSGFSGHQHHQEVALATLSLLLEQIRDDGSSFLIYFSRERQRKRDSHDELSDYLNSQEGLEVNSGSNLLCLIFLSELLSIKSLFFICLLHVNDWCGSHNFV